MGTTYLFDRSVRALNVAAVLLLLAMSAAGCGQDERHRDPAAAQRERLVREAKAALSHYHARPVMPGRYRGRGVRLRVGAHRRVAFSIRVRCAGRRLRAFPDRPPRLTRGGRFSYRERRRRYRLRVTGRVRTATARGRVALVARPARGRGCRVRAAWRAASA
jgi:hypothetical protein